MSDAVSKVGKPQLRGLLQNQIKKNLIVAITLCIAAGIGVKFFINDVRKAKYAEFYKNYDIDKEFETMKSKGLFDSCGPNKKN